MSAVAFLPTKEAAAFLGWRPQTLRVKRMNGDGPAWIKLGDGRSCRCVYRVSDLELWLAAHTHNQVVEDDAA